MLMYKEGEKIKTIVALQSEEALSTTRELGEIYSCCSAALQLAHSQPCSTAWECIRMIGYDSLSETPTKKLNK